MTHPDSSAAGPPGPQADMTVLDEPRFQEPAGWRWHRFTTSGGYRLRYGSAHPKDKIADAVVVILPGLRDFAEQYFELSRNLLDRNMAVWVLDWRGQGESDRYLPNRQKRHSAGFDCDLRDLTELVEGYILPSAVHPDVGRLPLVMLGHSMGAHLGLRFLQERNTSQKGKQIFSAAGFVSPMLWIDKLKPMPMRFALSLSALLCMIPGSYVPGGENWSLTYRQNQHRSGKYSHDTRRTLLQDAWFTRREVLQVGSPTTRWLFEAIKSCIRLNKPSYLQAIHTPTLIAVASEDEIVSNSHTETAAKYLNDCSYMEIPGALHEIMMETDDLRQPFLDQFFTFVEENVLKKANKGMTTF